MAKQLNTRSALDDQIKPRVERYIDPGEPSGYEGPGKYATPSGDAMTGAYAQARGRAIYEAHGRNANAIARMKMDPSYAAARAAGIQMPGDGMKGTKNLQKTVSGFGKPDEIIGGGTGGGLRDAGAMYRSATGATPVAQAGYEGPSSQASGNSSAVRTAFAKGSEITSPSSSSPSETRAAARIRDEANNMPVTKEASGSQELPAEIPAVGEEPKPATTPEADSPVTKETTKGQRLDTKREKPDTGTTRDYNRTKGPTEQQNADANFNKKGGGADDLRKNQSDVDSINSDFEKAGDYSAEAKMARQDKLNQAQDAREQVKMASDKADAAAYRKDERERVLTGYKTEKGDTEITQKTGEVQDRSQYLSREDQARGQGKVTGRNITYMVDKGTRSPDSGPRAANEKEMVTTTVKNKGTYTQNANGTYRYEPAKDSVMSFQSAGQNKADAMKEGQTSTYGGVDVNKDATQMSDKEKYVGGTPERPADPLAEKGAKLSPEYSGPPQAMKPNPTTLAFDQQSALDKRAGQLSAGSNDSGKADRGAQSPELTKQSMEGSNQGAGNALNNSKVDLAPLNDKAPGYSGPKTADPDLKKKATAKDTGNGKGTLPVG